MPILTAALDAAHAPAVQRAAADIATATGVLTSPWWLDLVSYAYHGTTAVAALALLVMRLHLTWREIKAKRSPVNALTPAETPVAPSETVHR